MNSSSDSVVVLGDSGSSSSSENAPVVESAPAPAESTTMTVSLDESQYSQICQYMATQMYITLAIFGAVALCLGVLIAQQVLRRWGVR